MEIAILTENLSKTYITGKIRVEAVKDVNLSVKSGEFVAIVGPSGSGKTTLISMIGCVLTPTSGTLKLLGKQITWREEKLSQIRRENIGFIFQHFNLLSSMSVYENIKIMVSLHRLKPEEVHKRVLSSLQVTGLEKRRDFLPRDLSGGEKQRLAIARVIATDRPIILADEPTGNLDSTTGLNIVKLLKECSLCYNKTVIVVTHDHRIIDIADRVLKMEDGRVYDS